MKKILFFLVLIVSLNLHAQQKVIQLYEGNAPGSESWNWEEKENNHNMFNTKVVYNVVHPSLTVFKPDSSLANGSAIIICPGGGFISLSINSEGIDVAKWLNKKGVTAFVLKYRLIHSTTDDPTKEFMSKLGSKEYMDESAKLIPLAIADGREALKYVREHASEYGIAPDRIGIIGFSAGGTVAASSAYDYTKENKPDFVAPIYAYMPPMLQKDIQQDAPPMFLAAATDDQLGLQTNSVDLYTKWTAAKHSAELHIYAKGGHGFGMRTQTLPVDTWIDRFGEWLGMMGFLNGFDPKGTTQLPPADRAAENKKRQEEQMHNDWAFIRRYKDENSDLKPTSSGEKRVVFMGNSITEGWKAKDSSFFTNNNYLDRGISGQTTPQMLIRFRPDVIDLNPAVVVILAGINDIAQNTGPATIESIYGNIVSMAELAKASNIGVVLSSVLPAYDFPWHPGMEPAEKVVELNNMIRSYAEKNNIVYLDYYSPMVDEKKGLKKEYTQDGVHPTIEGYKIMEPFAQRAIAEALKRK